MIFSLNRLTVITAITLGLAIQTTPASATNVVSCESFRGRYNFCRVDTKGGVRLRRQISNAECRQGRTWGYDRDGIWVDAGCSAEFEVQGRFNDNDFGNQPNQGNNDAAAIIGGALVIGAIAAAIASGSDSGSNNDGNTITCNSTNDSFTRCSTSLSRGDRVILRRQLSKSGCWEGSTWGYDRNGIWVDQGCRAVFEVRRR